MRLEPHIQQLIQDGRLRVDTEKGLVFSNKSNTTEKPLGAITAKGYSRVCLSVQGKQVHAMKHRIIWIAAYGSVPKGMQIDHVNGTKSDNRLANLDCVSGDENMKRAAKIGLTNGGWKDGPRCPVTGRFLGKKHAGRLLDGVEHNGEPG